MQHSGQRGRQRAGVVHIQCEVECVYSDGAISCYDASRLFHNFLGWEATYENKPPTMPAWFISKGKYAMDEGGQKKWSWKKAVNFPYGSDESGFEGGFIMKKVKNAS